MADFTVFDSILDATFVLTGDGKIVYCNDAGATFCQTSVRRVVNKVVLSDLLSVAEPGILPFTPESQGRLSPTSIIETGFSLIKSAHSGKVQLSVRPVDSEHWIMFLRDVSLEEALHSKYRSELNQKEEYARNLEKLVEARTAELRMVNQTLNAILDSLGQGFFTFNEQGDCGDVFTKACADVLQGIPKGRKAWEMLGVSGKEREQFQRWMESSFKEYLPFEDLRGLGPDLFPHSQAKHVVLEYYPIRREQELISEIVVVATDKTGEHEAQLALETERHYAAMIVKYIKNKDQFLQFLASVHLAIDTLKGLASSPLTRETLNESFRILHTLEGEAGTFSLRQLRQHSRDSQHVLESVKGQTDVPREVQAAYVLSLNTLHERYVAFLDENQNIFRVPNAESARSVEVTMVAIESFARDLERAQAAVALRLRYNELFLKTSIESRLKYFDSLMQSIAERLGKKVKPLVIEGGELRIFPEPYQKLFASLVHAFRNAVDHGVEMPEEREWSGKDPAAQIRVGVKPTEGGFLMNIEDDGAGIDPAKIREKLKGKYPERDFSAQTDEEIIQNVSMPGFSSRDSVGEFSGRGVGLDALREEVLNMGGTLHLKSKLGKGTTIEIFVPEVGYDVDLLRSA